MDPGTIVVLGGSEPERAQLVAQLAGSGLGVRGEAQLAVVGAPPALIVVVGPDASLTVAEIRNTPPFAELPILAVVAAIPATLATEALATGATDVVVVPVQPGVLAARCRNLCRLGRRDLATAHTLSRINEVLTTHGATRRRSRSARTCSSVPHQRWLRRAQLATVVNTPLRGSASSTVSAPATPARAANMAGTRSPSSYQCTDAHST